MVFHKLVRKSFRDSMRNRSPAYRERLSRWRDGKSVQRVANPSNPVRARELGYLAQKGFAVALVRIKRGKRARRKADLGRKPAKNRKFVNPGRAMTYYAEEKAKRRFPNMQILNSYFVASDGVHKYFEIIMRERA